MKTPTRTFTTVYLQIHLGEKGRAFDVDSSIYRLFILVHLLTVFANFSAPFIGYKSLSRIRDFPLVINDACPKLHVLFLWFVYRDIIGLCLLIYILHC